jgi:hypothetical protein
MTWYDKISIFCPTCKKVNSFEELECEHIVENDILRVDSLVECGKCGNSFKIVQRFTIDFLDCYVQEIPKPQKKKYKTEGCPHWAVFCEDCYKYNSEMCSRWEE